MKPNCFTIVVFALIGTVFFSCKKDQFYDAGQLIDFPEAENDTSFITDEYIKSLIFKPGTFWVYKNDSTGAKDSLYVEDNFHTFFYRDYPGIYDNSEWVEFIKITIRSSTDLYYMYVMGGRITHSYVDRIPSFSDFSMPGQVVLGSLQTDSMLVNNYWHKDIREKQIIVAEQTEMFYNEDTDLYFAKNVGIIKRTTANQSWSLVNWNIQQ